MNMNVPSIAISEVKDILMLHWKTDKKRVPMFWGPPGIGKTSVIEQFAKDIGARYQPFMLASVRASEVTGLMFIDKDQVPHRTGTTLPFWFPLDPDEKVILHFDEFTEAPDSIRTTVYTLINERRLNNYKMSDNSLIVLSGNEEDDGALHGTLSKACANRLSHFKVYTSTRYMEHVINNWHPFVQTYLHARPNNLIDNSGRDIAYPSPRSWEAVSDLLKAADNNYNEAVKNCVLARIGVEVGNDFVSMISAINQLPNVTKLLKEGSPEEIADYIKPDVKGFGIAYSIITACKGIPEYIKVAEALKLIKNSKNTALEEVYIYATLTLFRELESHKLLLKAATESPTLSELINNVAEIRDRLTNS